MVKDGQDERRASPRIRLRRSVTVTLRGLQFDTYTINISTGGASVEMIVPPEQGARGNVLLPLTDGAPLDFVAEVRWTSALSTSGVSGEDTRHLVGLKFVDPPADAAARLADALAAEDEDEDITA